MKNYKVEVWYRYISYGEQEKDFEVFDVEAESEEEAIKIALEEYKDQSKAIIPFRTYAEEIN